ncbi:hypothetical protein [Riemerella anatipestifer]|uniref:Lipocalin-like domain-containing protein n=2 Tax=Riemerella anatipestifer TaxID=34085 RepID=J9R0B7_RIEAN|nr:hypothetical protein [Riemerella anatipestifer]AFR36400.1 hypothetical protein B739_1816 [Riemerella anatipestifer RA-CH-1]AIH01180.1 hypothetical protein M949_0009 [Riemerella anatipestifer CH3]AQY22879.1 hypothetical protein AB406_1938 [Riemerella anatipestifer]MCO4303810.1 hypothetical protein [Riemerella anatipestifer]MCO7331709.1 hypothetical protein [Riemerella anatipestifer]
MKYLVLGLSLLCLTTLFSCKNNDDDIEFVNQNSTPLEGVWKLQNIPSGSRLTFEKQNWKLESGTVRITGTFTLSGNTINAVVINRSGSGSSALQPDAFTGNIAIEGNKATFTNFSGNWYAVFSTWYQKQ